MAKRKSKEESHKKLTIDETENKGMMCPFCRICGFENFNFSDLGPTKDNPELLLEQAECKGCGKLFKVIRNHE